METLINPPLLDPPVWDGYHASRSTRPLKLHKNFILASLWTHNEFFGIFSNDIQF